MKYSFCESVTATSYSPWHIRQLTKEGKKLGGGVDTPSLCGRVKKMKGWDLETDINPFHLANGCCPECLKMFEERRDRPPPGKQKQSW
jgi:hypothetical protein